MGEKLDQPWLGSKGEPTVSRGAQHVADITQDVQKQIQDAFPTEWFGPGCKIGDVVLCEVPQRY